MFARVSEIDAPTDRIHDGIAQFRDKVLPAITGMDGFTRAYLLVDREAGKAISISVWDSAESMTASAGPADTLRTEVTQSMSGQASVSSYEIVISEPTG